MLLMKPELLADLDSIEGVRASVQGAIELEHSTIPPYLYALYSLGSDNKEIAGLIGSIVFEEMLHFTIAANLLNAIHGQPRIDHPDFIPTYPGPLPGSVESELTVHLERFSQEHTKNTFMVIEQPDEAVVIAPPSQAHAMATVPEHPVTIGEYYARILQALKDLSGPDKPLIFTGDHKLQVVWDFPAWEVSPITDLASAGTAINFIAEQGEGTTHSPMVDLGGEGELAHYYRFAEIVMAKKIVADPHAKSGWSYGGDQIPFDPLKVTPVVADPKASSYPAGSAARYGCDTFNYTYTSLLKVLHETFNGNPSRLGTAIGMMESLKEQALTLMTIDSGLGGKAGPSFEYQPTNP
jgi:Ferritin-like